MNKTLVVNSPQVAALACRIITDLDHAKPHEVVIRPKKSRRSLNQNSTFHGWCGEASQQFAEATGKFYTAEQWKDHFKGLFLPLETVEIRGHTTSRPRSTAELNTAEMAEFMTKVDHYCGSELNIYVTIPGQDY